MMMVPAYVSCSESSGFVTSLYALTQFNTNELTLIQSQSVRLSQFNTNELTLTLTSGAGAVRSKWKVPGSIPVSVRFPFNTNK